MPSLISVSDIDGSGESSEYLLHVNVTVSSIFVSRWRIQWNHMSNYAVCHSLQPYM